MKKKYRVRVKCILGVYEVQWAYYRLIPIWHTVTEFDEPPIAYDHIDDNWETLCLDYQDAEEFAKGIDTYEKLNAYYEQQNKLESDYLFRKYKRDIIEYPYKSKRIV